MAIRLSGAELARMKADFDAPSTQPPKAEPPKAEPEKRKRNRAVLRGVHLNFKFSEAEAEQLAFAAKVYGVKKTRIVSMGIARIYAEAVALARRPREAQLMTEAAIRAKLKDAGYSMRKQRGGNGYMIIQGNINAVVGGSGYTFTLADVADFIKREIGN